MGNSSVSVIRVWRSLGAEPKDQVSKLVRLSPRTSAREAVHLAAQEFNIDHPEDIAAEFCLCLVCFLDHLINVIFCFCFHW